MKILLIGDFTGNDSEGLTQVSKRIALLISGCYKTLTMNTKDVISIKNLIRINKFKPDIIHYVTGVTIRSMIITKLLKFFLLNRPKTVLSAVRVFLSPIEINLIKYFKPNMILTQAGKWDEVFTSVGIATEYLLNPIEMEKFKKLEVSTINLKRKYGIPTDKKIILHVGHIRENRNIKSLTKISSVLKERGFSVVIVASLAFAHDKQLVEKLIKSDFIILNGFIEKIEELYNIADIYFFPVKGLSKNYFPKGYNEVGVIDTPLTVLEAIAIGIPIVTTEIDSLRTILEQNTIQNYVIWDGFSDLLPLFEKRIKLNINPYGETAKKFSTESVLKELKLIYNKLVA